MFLGGPDSGESIFSEFEKDSGLDVESIEYAEIFLDADAFLGIGDGDEKQSDAVAPQMGTVIRGDFDEADVVASMERAMEEGPGGSYEVEDYRGYDIYYDPMTTSENFAFVFPEPGVFAFGTIESVREIIDVAVGAVPAASGEGIRMLEAHGPRHLGLVMQLPPEAMELARGGGDGGLSQVGSLVPGVLAASTIVVSMLVQDDALSVRSTQLFDDEKSAGASREFNEGSMLMVGVMSGSPEIQRLMSDTEVSQDGATLFYDMTLDEASINAVLDFLQLLSELGEAQTEN